MLTTICLTKLPGGVEQSNEDCGLPHCRPWALQLPMGQLTTPRVLGPQVLCGRSAQASVLAQRQIAGMFAHQNQLASREQGGL